MSTPFNKKILFYTPEGGSFSSPAAKHNEAHTPPPLQLQSQLQWPHRLQLRLQPNMQLPLNMNLQLPLELPIHMQLQVKLPMNGPCNCNGPCKWGCNCPHNRFQLKIENRCVQRSLLQ